MIESKRGCLAPSMDVYTLRCDGSALALPLPAESAMTPLSIRYASLIFLPVRLSNLSLKLSISVHVSPWLMKLRSADTPKPR